MTQAELAGCMGYSTPALRKIEADQRRPSKQLAELLANTLRIPREDQSTFIRVARGELSVERLHLSRSPNTAIETSAAETDARGASLPIQLTPLIGREAELATLDKLLNNPDCRLLTITGMGGVGKTRVAIELASRQRTVFPGGVFYVPLASLNSPEFIVPAIAEVFRLSTLGTLDPQEKLFNLLAARAREPLLLVLDNIEQLLVPSDPEDSKFDAAILLIKLLQNVPNLKILVTSLERINIQGEWTFELHGLPVPVSDHPTPVETFSAPALFLQYARQVKTDFTVSPDEQPALVKICQIVEGNPLALELAAAWVGMFSIDEIARELAADLDFLKTSMRDIPDRHRSLRAVLDHSWRLLTVEEQQGLCRLAVFRGGFQREAAERVTGASLQVLMSLHSKSLLLHREDGRFDLNEIVRRYALFRLTDDPQNEATRERHGEYYLGIAFEQENALNGNSPSKAVQIVLSELDNLRTAMAWGLENHQAEQSLQIAIALGEFWHTQGYWREGLEWLERGLGSPEKISDTVRARALTVAGRLSRNTADYPKSIAMLQESARLWRQVNNETDLALAQCNLGASILRQGDVASAKTLLEDALYLSRQQGYPLGIYFSLGLLGRVASRQGNTQMAVKLYNDALVLAQKVEDHNQVASLLHRLGDEYTLLGDYVRAESYYELATGIYQKLGYRAAEPYILCSRGYIATKQGNFRKASDLLIKALLSFSELGDKEVVLKCLGYTALLANEQHLTNRTVRLLGAIDSLLKATGLVFEPSMQREYDKCLASSRGRLSDAAFASAWSEGGKMTYEEVITYTTDRSG